jgi:hypothetical protein
MERERWEGGGCSGKGGKGEDGAGKVGRGRMERERWEGGGWSRKGGRAEEGSELPPAQIIPNTSFHLRELPHRRGTVSTSPSSTPASKSPLIYPNVSQFILFV